MYTQPRIQTKKEDTDGRSIVVGLVTRLSLDDVFLYEGYGTSGKAQIAQSGFSTIRGVRGLWLGREDNRARDTAAGSAKPDDSASVLPPTSCNVGGEAYRRGGPTENFIGSDDHAPKE